MPSNGAGSQRIVLIGEPGARRETPSPAQPTAKQPSMQQHGWTTRRLTIAGALGGAATIAGGVVFMAGFGDLSDTTGSPVLAIGFGLFVIGMVVFCAALIALIGTGISVLAERRGWSPAAVAVFAPLALVWALWALGAVGYAVPAVLSLVLIGGLVVALK
jgi:hypothetical protein